MTHYQSSNGLLLPLSSNGHASPERGAGVMQELYEATIRDLELQLRENHWLRLGDDSQEFSRQTIGEIVATARAFYLKNPLINRAVEVGALYVWGQDLAVTADDEIVQEVVDRFWRLNQSTLTGQQASRLLEVELEVTGNVFMALFANAETGETRVRMVPVEQIQEIITNPDDRAEVWYYRRTWTQRKADGMGDEQMTMFYPDWRYTPGKNKPPSIATNGQDAPIVWGAPIAHIKAGAFLHWLWGVSEMYSALDWARAYKGTLENDVTRSAALARFAYKLTTGGGAASVTSAQARIQSTLGAGNGVESNPPPTAGSSFIRGNKNQDLEAVDISRAILPVDHSRPIRLMTAAAVGLPETFFGDADVGNHATAKTLDRPTELRYNERRSMWRDFFYELIQWVIDRDVAATSGILRTVPNDEQRKVNLAWPDLLEPDVQARVMAVVDAATLSGRTPAGTIPEETTARELMSAIGIEDIDGEIAKLVIEKAERERKAAEVARQMQPTQPTGPTGPAQPTGPTGTTGATGTAESLREADDSDIEEITDEDLEDAAEAFDRWVPRAKGLLDAKVVE